MYYDLLNKGFIGDHEQELFFSFFQELHLQRAVQQVVHESALTRARVAYHHHSGLALCEFSATLAKLDARRKHREGIILRKRCPLVGESRTNNSLNALGKHGEERTLKFVAIR